jgi:Core-2/I-Branching enzyme
LIVAVRIAFGIMSARQQASTVDQLIGTLGDHAVRIHHDFWQRPDFSIRRPNVRFVPDPVKTGWGNWGFSQAILHTIEYCLRNVEFDYFQLLSPTCLPIRPIAEFERHLQSGQDDVHADLLDLSENHDALMDYTHRVFLPERSLRYRVLRQARNWYLGPDPIRSHRSSLSVLMPANGATPRRMLARGSAALMRMTQAGWLGSHPFGPQMRAFVGSTWFGASRATCEFLVRSAKDPALQAFFSKAFLPDELMFPTLIGNSRLRIGGSNHLINRFDDDGHPIWMQNRDIDRIMAAPVFFARKFRDDARDPTRLELIERLSNGRSPRAVPPASDGPAGGHEGRVVGLAPHGVMR